MRITAGWSLRHHPDQAARAEPGSDLLALGGQYAELYTLQATQYSL